MKNFDFERIDRAVQEFVFENLEKLPKKIYLKYGRDYALGMYASLLISLNREIDFDLGKAITDFLPVINKKIDDELFKNYYYNPDPDDEPMPSMKRSRSL